MRYLEDGVHGDRQWALPRILRDLKDVNPPSVYVLHLLQMDNKSRGHDTIQREGNSNNTHRSTNV